MAEFTSSGRKGVALALGSLVLLAVMPIISNMRPLATDALSFAFALSVWQIVFAGPLMGLSCGLARPGFLVSICHGVCAGACF